MGEKIIQPPFYNGGFYNGGFYNGGFYNKGNVSPVPPGYTIFKYLENKVFTSNVFGYIGSVPVNFGDTIEVFLEFPNKINSSIEWFNIFDDFGQMIGARLSNYGSRALQSAWNKDITNVSKISAGGNYNNFLNAENILHYKANKDKVYINETEYNNNLGAAFTTLNLNRIIQSSHSCVCRFIEFFVYDENMDITEHGIPCKDPDGKSGIYKLVSNTFVNNDTWFNSLDS